MLVKDALEHSIAMGLNSQTPSASKNEIFLNISGWPDIPTEGRTQLSNSSPEKTSRTWSRRSVGSSAKGRRSSSYPRTACHVCVWMDHCFPPNIRKSNLASRIDKQHLQIEDRLRQQVEGTSIFRVSVFYFLFFCGLLLVVTLPAP